MKIKKAKKVSDLFDKKSFDVLSRIFLSSFIVVCFFYVMPVFINFAEKNLNRKEVANNS